MKIPKTIYLTYKEKPPSRVLLRWKLLNPHYKIDFSLDKDCIDFLNKYFNSKIADLFKNIKIGMFKADLWRICKLYIHGGYYADIDLVPLYPLDKIGFKENTFYSSRGMDNMQIFQAFMATPPKNPLLLALLCHFYKINHTKNLILSQINGLDQLLICIIL